MLRPVLRRSPAIFLSIDYERYDSRLGAEDNPKSTPRREVSATDIVSSCAFASHAETLPCVVNASRIALGAEKQTSSVEEYAQASATIDGLTPRGTDASAQRHWVFLPSIRREACYSLRRADGVPPISCVIFATHSSKAGATLFSSASRGA